MISDEIIKILTSCNESVKYFFGDNAILTYHESYDRHGKVKFGGFYITYNNIDEADEDEVTYEPISLHDLEKLNNNYINLNKRVR